MEIKFSLSAVTVALAIQCSNIWYASGQQTADTYHYQTDGFNSDSVKSNPLVIVDKKTIFVPSLHYIAIQQARFAVGTDSPKNQTLITNEEKSEGPLRTYRGSNIYLRLPGNLTTGEIDYLAVWALSSKTELGRVVLFPNGSEYGRENIPEALGYHQVTRDNRTIFRIPKCCPPDVDCESNKTEKMSYRVYKSNQTHIDPDVKVSNVTFIPYEYSLECGENQNMYNLEQTEALGLLYNNSLIYIIDVEHGFLPHSNFCMANDGNSTKVFMCFNFITQEAKTFPNLYLPLLIISMICFFLSALCYLFILKAKDVHQKCFVGYTSSMTITFLSLILLQQTTGACNFVGGIFFFSILCSVTWLACLCVDLVFLIRPVKQLPDEKRIYYYIAFSLSVPVLFLIISIGPDGKPDVPKSFVKRYSDAMCSFQDASLYHVFIPIVLLIAVALGGLCSTSWLIRTKDVTPRDFDWVLNKSNRKFMLRSCFLLWVTTCIWLVEAFAHVLTEVTVLHFAIDLIEASQGIFVLFIFILNKYTRKKIRRVLRNRHIKYNEWLVNLKAEDNTAPNDNKSDTDPDDGIKLTEMNSDKTDKPGETSANSNH